MSVAEIIIYFISTLALFVFFGVCIAEDIKERKSKPKQLTSAEIMKIEAKEGLIQNNLIYALDHDEVAYEYNFTEALEKYEIKQERYVGKFLSKDYETGEEYYEKFVTQIFNIKNKYYFLQSYYDLYLDNVTDVIEEPRQNPIPVVKRIVKGQTVWMHEGKILDKTKLYDTQDFPENGRFFIRF